MFKHFRTEKISSFTLLILFFFPFQLQIDNATSFRQWHDEWSCSYRYRERYEDKYWLEIAANRSRHKQHNHSYGTRYLLTSPRVIGHQPVYTCSFSSLSIPVFQSSPHIAEPLSIRTWYGDKNGKYYIELAEGTIVGGNTTLQVNLKFISQLSNTLQGFYRVLYQDSGSDMKK